MRAAVVGAGSIGNHLTYSARKMGWNVTVFDKDPGALVRFKNEIFPLRYGEFDSEIQLCQVSEIILSQSGIFDIILVGTPPDTHLAILKDILKLRPRVIFIEKPMCPPVDSEINEFKKIIDNNPEIIFICGYNHRLSLVTTALIDTLENDNDSIESLNVSWLESWDGILKAHPWNKGPEDTYLGWTNRGGGALYEHSHGLDLWLLLARICHLGTPRKVLASGTLSTTQGMNYDESISIQITTDKGFVGSIKQDVLTNPPVKRIEMKSQKYSYEVDFGRQGKDLFKLEPIHGQIGGFEMAVKKPRPADFDSEIEFIHKMLTKPHQIQRVRFLDALSGLRTALVAKKAIDSLNLGKEIEIVERDWFDVNK